MATVVPMLWPGRPFFELGDDLTTASVDAGNLAFDGKFLLARSHPLDGLAHISRRLAVGGIADVQDVLVIVGRVAVGGAG